MLDRYYQKLIAYLSSMSQYDPAQSACTNILFWTASLSSLHPHNPIRNTTFLTKTHSRCLQVHSPSQCCQLRFAPASHGTYNMQGPMSCLPASPVTPAYPLLCRVQCHFRASRCCYPFDLVLSVQDKGPMHLRSSSVLLPLSFCARMRKAPVL